MMHLFPGHSCTPPTANWGFWFILIQIRYSCLVYAVLLVASFWLSIVDLLFFQTYIFSDVVFIFTVVLLLLTFCLYTPTLSNVRPRPMDRTTTGSFWGTILVNKSSRTDMLWIGIGFPQSYYPSSSFFAYYCFIPGAGIIPEIRCAYFNGLTRGSGP